jgi:hypothetical protein
MKAHSRFSEGGSDCFVVSPIGPEKTAVRERADFVFETYIKPACEYTNYRARRSDQIISPKIDIEMLKRLVESPMVVVYLGSPKYGWNPNVMYEFGYRDSREKPLIVLRDATADGKPYDLPFDIQNYRCIDIPEDDKGSKDDYGSYIRTIRDYLEEAAPPPKLAYPYPSATVEVSGGKAIIIEKTGELEQLFDMSQVLRKNLQTDILPHLYECMAPEQMVAFGDEQSKLIGNIMIGAYKDVHATVPMLFSTHRAFHGRAFLPVIVSHSTVGNVLRLNVIYIEVTGVLKKDAAGHFYCDLVGQPIPEPPPSDENVIAIKA